MANDRTPERRFVRIDELYAWISVDPADDSEGICSVWTAELGHTPMIGADRARIESYRSTVEQITRASGIPARLVRFHGREVLETIGDAE